MADNEVQYEFKTVKAIRGTEARTTSKWENEGWEFVSQDKGTLRSEITFRRPKRKTPWRLFAVGGGIALLIAVAITVGAIQDGSGNAVADPVASPTHTEAREEEGTAAASPEASIGQASETAETAKPEEEVLTVENSRDLAALLAITDYCIEPAVVFAAQHQGKTIAFDGSIGAMIPHGDYKTRYDILIGAGDFSETTSPGPAFQFRDVNATSDMHFTDTDRPDTIGVGDNLRVTARVVGFEESSCLFLLDPVRTSFR